MCCTMVCKVRKTSYFQYILYTNIYAVNMNTLFVSFCHVTIGGLDYSPNITVYKCTRKLHNFVYI